MDPLTPISYPESGGVNEDSGGVVRRSARILSADGFIYFVDGDVMGKGTGSISHPFHLADASNADDGKRVRVYYGTVSDTAPDGMSDGDDPPYYATGLTGTGVIYLVVHFTDGSIDSVTIAWAATKPDDSLSEDSGTVYKEIGSYSVGTTNVTTADNLIGSLTCELCRDWFSSDPVEYDPDWRTV